MSADIIWLNDVSNIKLQVTQIIATKILPIMHDQLERKSIVFQ